MQGCAAGRFLLSLRAYGSIFHCCLRTFLYLWKEGPQAASPAAGTSKNRKAMASGSDPRNIDFSLKTLSLCTLPYRYSRRYCCWDFFRLCSVLARRHAGTDSLLTFYNFRRQKEPGKLISRAVRGADRIWTGESGCCRPTPYHLATAPYYILNTQCMNQQMRVMTPTGIEPVLPPWKGDVLTAWPRGHNTVTASAVTVLYVSIQ